MSDHYIHLAVWYWLARMVDLWSHWHTPSFWPHGQKVPDAPQ